METGFPLIHSRPLPLPGYDMQEYVHANGEVLVYRGISLADGNAVLIKGHGPETPVPEELHRLRHEYEILLSLQLEGVAKPLALEPWGNGLALVLPDTGGIPLAQRAEQSPGHPGEVLDFAISMARMVRDLHGLGITHGDLSPWAVEVHPATRRIHLAHFGRAIRHRKGRTGDEGIARLEDVTGFTAPECTGRVNLPRDARADLFSIGAILYGLLTGKPAFSGKDPGELLHSLLAKSPPPPHALRPSVPAGLSVIVMKLLAKSPEERYKTAASLWADLAECRRQLAATGSVTPFPLGHGDLSDQLKPDGRLYGRASEMRELHSALDRAAQGSCEVVVIFGSSGMGKSVLAESLREPAARRKAGFFSGKSEQYAANPPLASLVQALRDAIGKIVAEGGATLEAVKKSIQDSLGANGSLITSLIPEAEWIIGPQLPVPETGPVESQNRFYLAFRNFVKTFMRPEHPLVVILEDIQWADASTHQLLRMISSDPEAHHFLLVITAREERPPQSWLQYLESIRATKLGLKEIYLAPLPLPETCQLLADKLDCPSDRVAPLAGIIQAKTGGNPFFIGEFLKNIHAANHLVFHVQDDGEGLPSGWRWNLDAISRTRITANVVDLLVARIHAQGPSTEATLKASACLGGKLDSRMLAVIMGVGEAEAQVRLREASDAGFLRMSGDEFEFQHDRVMQAAYGLLSDPEQKEIHLAAGRHMKQLLEPTWNSEALFTVVNHLNAGETMITEYSERLDAARLNFLAGTRAKSAAAYELAGRYFGAGTSFLSPASWDREYDMLFALTLGCAESEYQQVRIPNAEALFDGLLARAKTGLDRARVSAIRIRLHEHQGKYAEIISEGQEALTALGFNLPRKPNPLHLLKELAIVKWLLRGKTMESLANSRDQVSPEAKAAMGILMDMWGPSHWLDQSLNGLIVFQMVKLSIRFGNQEATPVAYACFAVFTSLALRNHAKAMEVANFALRMAEGGGNAQILGRTLFIHSTFFGPRAGTNQANLQCYRRAFKLSRESGDLIYAGYCFEGIASTVHLTSACIAEIREELNAFGDFPSQAGNPALVAVARILERWMAILREPGRSPADAPDYGADILAATNPFFETERGIHHLLQLKLACTFRDWRAAMVSAEALRKNPIVQGHPGQGAMYHLHHVVALSETSRAASHRQRRHIRNQIRKSCGKLAGLAQLSPLHAGHAHLIASAVAAEFRERPAEAERLFEKGIALAKEGRFLLDEALGNELAYRFYRRRGLTNAASAYFRDAHRLYSQWGALAKAASLDAERAVPLAPTPGQADPLAVRKSPVRTLPDGLDLTAVMNASLAISGEIVLDRLLEKLLRIIMENAGAQKGLLIMENKGRLVVEAAGEIEGEVNVMLGQPLDECPEVSTGIVNFVARSERDLVLDEAAKDPRLAQDAYVQRHGIRSVLCSPLMSQGRLVGIIYLENNLAAGVFTPQRLEFLRLLSGQAVVSLANANFYNLQIEALQAKINPHFLFNALSSIAELTLTDPANSEAAILKLSRLYRYVLTSSESRTVGLAQELEIVRSYLALEKIRLRDRLDFSIEVSGSLECVQIPGLIIQPLVENCIRHGLSSRVGGGSVTVIVEVGEDVCRIVVADNGIGWNKTKPGTGHGLKNVQARLGLIFGEEYSMSIKVRDGVTIEITIPVAKS